MWLQLPDRATPRQSTETLQGLRGGLGGEEATAAPAGSVPTMEVIQGSGAAGEIIHQMDASLLEVSPSP